MIHRLSNLVPFFCPGDSLGELSTGGKYVDQPGSGLNRGQIRLAEALADQVAIEGLDVALEIFPRTRVVAKTEIGQPQMVIRYDPKGEIPTDGGGGEAAVARLDRAVEIARSPEMERHEGGDPSQPALIADLLGENLTFAKVIEDSLELSERVERIAKLQQEINPLLDRSSALREMPESFERLLEARDCFPVGRARGGLRPGLTEVRHRPEQGQWHVLADGGCRLQERSVLRGQAVDASREDRLNGGGHPDLAGRPRAPVVATIADEHARLDRRSHAFLEEERVAAGAFDQNRLDRCRGVLTSHQAIEEDVGILRRERVEPELRVVALVAPGVLVFGTIAQEKQNPMARDALDQGLEHRLRLGVDPGEILEEHGHRLAATLLEEQQLHRLQRPPLLLGGIELRPLRIVDRHVDEREDGRKR